MVQHGMAWQGKAQNGMAWHRTAQHGRARQGTAQHSRARHGTAWHGTAQHSLALYRGHHRMQCIARVETQPQVQWDSMARTGQAPAHGVRQSISKQRLRAAAACLHSCRPVSQPHRMLALMPASQPHSLMPACQPVSTQPAHLQGRQGWWQSHRLPCCHWDQPPLEQRQCCEMSPSLRLWQQQ